MAHTFKTISGRSTFGVYNEPLDSGQYTKNKKAVATFCSANVCKPSKPVNTQSNLLLRNTANFLNYYSCDNVTASNLYINLLTKIDLSGVNVIQNNNAPFNCPTDISSNVIPFSNYLIDPSGNLFGNTQCGINNFEKYIIYNP